MGTLGGSRQVSGTVVDQLPAAGSRLASGSAVTLSSRDSISSRKLGYDMKVNVDGISIDGNTATVAASETMRLHAAKGGKPWTIQGVSTR